MSAPDHPYVPEGAVAIVGMAGRFPGAEDVERFWENVGSGRDSVARLSDDALDAAGVSRRRRADPNFVPAEAILDRMEYFDAGFFGMSPRDAAIMDPQVRNFLECAWHAMESAGHVPDRFPGSVGVFAGCGVNRYFWQNVLADPELRETVGFFLLRHTGNDKDFLSTRVSYEFDLTGPSVGIQTACSTSLVAVHYACESLLSRECDMALAGGATISQPHGTGYVYREGEILAPDGHCRSFDRRSAGTVFGSGVGVVVLRRLEDALADGDPIRAIVRGSAVNNDGARKVSYLAPSVDGQAQAVAEAISMAGVDPETIGFVEGHGTGTPIGDPIEVEALTQAFRTGTDERGFCALGSVKSNIGHLDTAAGVASLIKAVQALEHGEVPPTAHFEEPNPRIDFESSPFFVNRERIPWPALGEKRRAAVNSLGVGGTNAHVVLEEAPVGRTSGPSRPWQILPISGRSRSVVEAASRRLVDHLESRPDTPLADASYTLRHGRRGFEHRRAVVCADASDAIELLATGRGERLVDGVSPAAERGVVFLFAGGGAQHPGMGRELYEREPVFRQAAERCLRHLEATEPDLEIRSLLDPDPGEKEEADRRLRRPSRALPALFTIQYAQARLWESWGIEPVSMIGHSMGEYTAACLAGVFTPEDALSLVTVRGRLFETVDAGAMTSVQLPAAELESLLGDHLSLAAVNAPELSLAAGPVDEVAALEARLAERGVDTRRIRIDVAAHSSMLDPILPEFRTYASRMTLSPPRRPFVSNLSGEAAGDEVTDPEYWVRHLRSTVRFADGLSGLLDPGGPALLEVGPGRTLATLARLHGGWSPEQPIVQSLPHPGDADGDEGDAQAFTLTALGTLWAHGVEPDWAAFDGDESRRRIPLPGYPFEREPHFVDPPAPVEETPSSLAPKSGEEESADGAPAEDPARWTYRRTWTPSPTAPGLPEEDPGTVLLLADDGTPAAELLPRLGAAGYDVVRVRRAETFREEDADGLRFGLRPGDPDDWRALVQRLQAAGALPSLVVHGWCLDEGSSPCISPSPGEAARIEEHAFFAPLRLLQAFESAAPGWPVRLVAAATGIFGVDDDDAIEPLHSLLLGPVRVAPRELGSLEARIVDAGSCPPDASARAAWLNAVAEEVAARSESTVVALRDGERLVEAFEPDTLAPDPARDAVRPGGVYLITGGLGGIGLVMARTLAEREDVSLILVGRSGLPEEEAWDAWLAEKSADDKTARAIREVRALRSLGSDVVVFSGDVTDPARVDEIVAATVERFGGIDAVIHAAGVLDDGPLLARDEEKARTVLEPKVRGALALDRALRARALHPGATVLFSSVSAVLGAPGQIDYTAANAFLDAFARARSRAPDGGRTISIAWGPWREVGMAAELAGMERYGEDPRSSDDGVTPIDHPLFEARVETCDGVALRTRYAAGTHWMLDEHRLENGDRILPGSAYVELARAAFLEATGREVGHLRDLVFLRPFGISEDEVRELEVRITAGKDGHDVDFRSRRPGSRGWTDHASATVPDGGPEGNGFPDEPHDQILRRLGAPGPTDDRRHAFMQFGPRWSNLVAASRGENEALLRLELPDAFRPDLEVVPLHPALLDMATAGAQDMIPGLEGGVGALVPAGYGAVRVSGGLKPEMHSHVSLKEVDEGGDFASFDVAIYDEAGDVLVQITDFSMMRVSEARLSGDGPEEEEPDWLANAIPPARGAEMFLRVLGAASTEHVLVSPRPVDVLLDEIDRAAREPRGARRRKSPPVPTVDVRPVEEALASHEAVAEAAALAAPELDGGFRLVAFVVFERGQYATVSELRAFVRDRVPSELVPQNFVEESELPRDDDGRIDRGGLRDPFAREDDHVAPRTETEKIIASIWEDLLGLDRVSAHDNFLDVGGHSLVGIRTLVRIEQRTGVRLHANALTLQTLAQLAQEIEEQGGGPTETDTGEASHASQNGSPPEEGSEPGRETAPAEAGSPGREPFLSRVKERFLGR